MPVMPHASNVSCHSHTEMFYQQNMFLVGCSEDANAIPWPHEVLSLKTVAWVEVDVNKHNLFDG
jgi:hypothetical protein